MEGKKQCTKCKKIKTLEMFSLHSGNKADGRQSHCKSCYAKRERQKRIGNPCINCGISKEIDVPKGAKLCKKCSTFCYECKKNKREKQHRRCSSCRKKFDRNRKRILENKIKERITRIKSKYKVTIEKAILLSKIKKCESCGIKFKDSRNRHIDHCHKTDSVRGVLCFNCNAALGHVKDNQKKLLKLIKYLAKSKNGIKDLKKAIHFLERLIELEENNNKKMREKQITEHIKDIKFEASSLADSVGNFCDGPRCVFLMYRKKDGGHDKENRRVFDFELYRDKEELVSILEKFLWRATFLDIQTRIYVSVNKRDIKKSIRELESRLLEMHYTDEKQQNDVYHQLFRFPRTYLMQPSSLLKEEMMFLIDADNQEGRDIYGEALTWLSENKVEILLTQKTRNGWHIVTKPFNLNLFPKEIANVHKDGLLFIK